MDDILRNIIYLQNEDLLQRIAKDKYIDMEDREAFLNKYHNLIKNSYINMKITLFLPGLGNGGAERVFINLYKYLLMSHIY